jgi:diguanylate cyclase (GGDEF)-like protein/PAS domain S-box-containing protein
MYWQYSPFAFLLFATAGLCTLLGWYALRKRSVVGSRYLGLLLGMVAAWSLFNGMELLAVSLPAKKLFSIFQYPFIQSIPPLWLLFAASFTRQKVYPLTRRTLWLWLIPAVVVVLVLTNDLHRLIWQEVYLESTPYGIVAVYRHGYGMLLNASYSYVLLALGAALLLGAVVRTSTLQRQQSAALLGAVLVPFGSNVLYLTANPFPGLDLTPLAFGVTGLLLVFSVFRFGFMEVMPVAYDALFSNLSDGVVVLDDKRRVIDVNRSARSLLETGGHFTGQHVESLLGEHPQLLSLFDQPAWEQMEVEWRRESDSRWLEVNLSGVYDRRKRRTGWLLLFKDITHRKEAERQRRADASYIRLLNEITEAALGAPDLTSMLQILADRMGELIHADYCCITLWKPEGELTIPAAFSGEIRASSPRRKQFPGEHTITQAALREGRTHVLENAQAYAQAETGGNGSGEGLAQTRSLIAIPMRADEVWLGAVILGFNKPHTFTPSEIRRSEHGARQVSLAISKLRLLEDAKSRAAQLALLNRTGMIINSGLDMDSVIRSVFEQSRQALEMDAFYLALYDEKSGEIRFPVVYYDGAYQQRSPVAIQNNPGLVAHVLRSRQPVFIPDISSPGRELPFKLTHRDRSYARAVMAVPLLHNDHVLGVLSVQNCQPHVYREEHQYLLETLAAQGVVALENARLYAELKRLSTVDELTGLYNYRSLIELGSREFDRARRFQRPLCALFFDVDHFRNFNNRYSHATGNLVLAALADCARENLRAVDLVFRFGGEEFAALLPETSIETARLAAERLRSAVEQKAVSTMWGELRVTISIGVAELQPYMEDLDALLDAADHAEKRAKHMGRNQVEAA